MHTLQIASTLLFILFQTALSAQSPAFEVPEPDLFPEGITLDSATGKFYISSIAKNKIIEVSDGATKDFIRSGEYGFVGGLGIHIDAVHQILWACSGDLEGNTYTTGIFGFDLASRRLRYRYFLASDTVRNFFNDLAIAASGDVFITNSDNHSIWYWKHKALRPEKLPCAGVYEPNGIAWDEHRKLLFVATRQGLMSLSPDSKKAILLTMASGDSHGLDGIVLYKNSIIAVRNGFRDKTKHAVVRFDLSADGNRVEQSTVVDQNNIAFNIPTTLVIRGNHLFVIGNSQMDMLDQKKHTDPNQPLKKPVILKYKLID
jgi:hypothetical protein